MAKALGMTPEEECLPNSSSLSSYLVGHVGLFFTDQEPSDIIEHFATYSNTDFARAGALATRSVVIPAGIVHSRAGEGTRGGGRASSTLY